MANEKSTFDKLFGINVNEHTEKKNGLTYLSWAYAWAEVKKLFPNANYIVYERENGINYFTDGKTCWVKTGVVIDGLEHIEYLPVMDYNNRSIPLEKVTSFDVNKAIQRSLTKACARHGLGLYVYAGEDLPEDMGVVGENEEPTPKTTTNEEKGSIDKADLKTIEDYLFNLRSEQSRANFYTWLDKHFGTMNPEVLTLSQGAAVVEKLLGRMSKNG